MNAAAVLAAASGLETHHRLVLFVLLASPLGLAFRQLRDVQSRALAAPLWPPLAAPQPKWAAACTITPVSGARRRQATCST